MNSIAFLNIEHYVLNYFIQGIGLFSAIKSVSSNNPVSSILWLIVVFLVVYVGAIAVLFLFVVMMLNVRFIELNSKFLTYFPIAGVLVSLLVIFLSSIVHPGFSSFYSNLNTQGWLTSLNNFSNIETIAHSLYTYFAPLFLIASLILLVAMIGSIMLTLQRKGNVKRQIISQQLSHTFATQLNVKN